MNKKSVVLMLATSFLTGSALAGTMGPITQQPDWAWVGTLSAGPVWAYGGKTQTFYLAPEIEKTYTANKSTHALFDTDWGKSQLG